MIGMCLANLKSKTLCCMWTRDVETSGLVFECDYTVQKKSVPPEFVKWMYYSPKLDQRLTKYKSKVKCTI